MQVVRRLFPVGPVDKIVPVGNLVVHRAAAVTERNAAIHAARRLAFEIAFFQRNNEFVVIANPVAGGLVGAVVPLYLDKSGNFTHQPLLIPIFISPVCSTCSSCNARRYSTGMTLTNFGR